MSVLERCTTALLAETREELVRADSKANLLLAGAGVGSAALLGGLIAGDVSPWGQGAVVALLSTLGAVLVTLGLLAVGRAVYPRVGEPEAGRARYYAEIAAFGGDETSLRAALDTEGEDLEGRHVQQLAVLSTVVCDKYRDIHWAMGLLGAGFLLVALAGAISLIR